MSVPYSKIAATLFTTMKKRSDSFVGFEYDRNTEQLLIQINDEVISVLHRGSFLSRETEISTSRLPPAQLILEIANLEFNLKEMNDELEAYKKDCEKYKLRIAELESLACGTNEKRMAELSLEDSEPRATLDKIPLKAIRIRKEITRLANAIRENQTIDIFTPPVCKNYEEALTIATSAFTVFTTKEKTREFTIRTIAAAWEAFLYAEANNQLEQLHQDIDNTLQKSSGWTRSKKRIFKGFYNLLQICGTSAAATTLPNNFWTESDAGGAEAVKNAIDFLQKVKQGYEFDE